MGRQKVVKTNVVVESDEEEEQAPELTELTQKRILKFQKTKMIVERPAMLEDDSIFKSSIMALNWEDFLKWNAPASLEIVREFYASGIKLRRDSSRLWDFSVAVKDRWVVIHPAIVEDILHLSREEADLGYQLANVATLELRDERMRSLQTIVNTLCVHDTHWRMECDTPVMMERLHRKFLRTPLVRFWNVVATTRLAPMIHVDHLDIERAGMVAAAAKGAKFAVARKIIQRIRERFDQSPAIPFPFGGLITELCRRAGVDIEAHSSRLHVAEEGPIMDVTLGRYKGAKIEAGTPLTPLFSKDGDPYPVFISKAPRLTREESEDEEEEERDTWGEVRTRLDSVEGTQANLAREVSQMREATHAFQQRMMSSFGFHGPWK